MTAVRRTQTSRLVIVLAMAHLAPGCDVADHAADDDVAATADAAATAADAATADGAAADASPPEATAFLIDRFELRDPHIYFNLGCADITDAIAGGDGVNDYLDKMVTTDGDGDGLLDLSMLLVFEPLSPDAAGGTLESGVAECTAPLASTGCRSATPLKPTSYSNTSAGSCPGPFAGTTSAADYTPAVQAPSAPCFATAPTDQQFDFGGYVATLAGNQNTATYVGAPAGSLATGNFRAFLSEADAAAITVPLGALGTIPLADLLPGSATNCASHDDRDLGPDGVTGGWWFYFDFSARAVPYTRQAAAPAR